MNIRLAEEKDIEQLIKMRWDNTIEFDVSKEGEDYEKFATECYIFLQKALNSSEWFIWIAEDETGEISSHIYVELIHKVPRPGRITKPFAYMTNVYTKPESRNAGVGSELLSSINSWIKVNEYEFVIVWPSEDAENYYRKNGYVHCTEPMVYYPN
ncbi:MULTISPECIES: GNAT family N-acetyltransferase [Bacillaceae]|uniref:GNAT family N-acetyltransferase n=1 Tax=Evansella alkalicola TaxID=745819 RepID=A0ABS6JPD8_9BACI|nr:MULTISPECIES: GNAT family N-acetyltransferase [Bacillaceae]MBU9720127.1 GNAT family N-acetyltransferase [Bacillus alkalicola]